MNFNTKLTWAAVGFVGFILLGAAAALIAGCWRRKQSCGKLACICTEARDAAGGCAGPEQVSEEVMCYED